MKQFGKPGFACALFLMFFGGATLSAPATGDAPAWPALTSPTRPWIYWWWMGSALDKMNLTCELQRFVNLNYRPFDASDWPLTDSGLLGPVTLTAVVLERPASAAD
jgi:hypothetical protein